MWNLVILWNYWNHYNSLSWLHTMLSVIVLRGLFLSKKSMLADDTRLSIVEHCLEMLQQCSVPSGYYYQRKCNWYIAADTAWCSWFFNYFQPVACVSEMALNNCKNWVGFYWSMIKPRLGLSHIFSACRPYTVPMQSTIHISNNIDSVCVRRVNLCTSSMWSIWQYKLFM